MRQITPSLFCAITEKISKLPMRQITPNHYTIAMGKLSKLPMRQITTEGKWYV